MPQIDVNGNTAENITTPPPLIQFTDGGVQVNFAGFHAEVGIGGGSNGSNAGSGLHVSAGTPWGAQVSAGLGGSLGGDNATASGGLYAGASLGNGLPYAGVSLGGTLNQSASWDTDPDPPGSPPPYEVNNSSLRDIILKRRLGPGPRVSPIPCPVNIPFFFH